MSKYRRFIAPVAVVAACATAIVILPASGATGTVPANSVGSAQIINGSVWSADLADPLETWLRSTPDKSVWQNSLNANIVTEDKLAPAVRAKLNNMPAQGPAGPQGPQGPQGPAGPPGPAGDNAIVTVTAVTTLTDRPDSGVHGTWADDQLTRTVTVTRNGRVEAGMCQDGAAQCWFYTASLSDQGSFLTREGALSPEAGDPINGQLAGDVVGGSKIEFYASDDQPNPGLVPATVTGSAHPTSEWVTLFFPAGTKFRQTGNLINWKWTYTATQTCEVWVNKFDDNTGDIKGVNAC